MFTPKPYTCWFFCAMYRKLAKDACYSNAYNVSGDKKCDIGYVN